MTRRGRPRGRTERGHATRDALFAAAVQRFAEQGYDATTLRDIAEAAEVSPALVYRYFPSKIAIVLALYDDLSARFVDAAATLPPGPWDDRVVVAAALSLETLAPHRNLLGAVLPVLMVDRDGGILSRASWPARDRVRGVFVRAVAEADDPPAAARALGRLAYLAQLALLLFWVLDRTEGQAATDQLLGVVRAWRRLVRWLLRLPGASGLIEQLDAIAARALYDDPPG